MNCLEDPRCGGWFLRCQFPAPLVERRVLEADCDNSSFRFAGVRLRSPWKAAPVPGKARLMQSKAFGAPT